MSNSGKLYICPTPIGNLEDITIRVINTLSEVDLIAAEDTRHTLKLLNHYEIKKPLTSYHEHNKIEKGSYLLQKLIHGENIALVSDAGMPGISDPGEDMIKMAVENGIEVIALPGPTASILALVISGLPTGKFVFEGFLPSKKKDRIQRLEKLVNEERTIIFYESPHRLCKLLEDMQQVLGNREIAVARELTKKYEEIFRGYLNNAIDKFKSNTPRGEFVIVVRGISEELVDNIEKNEWNNISIKEHIILYITQGFDKKEAVKRVSKERGIPKKEVYKESIGI